MLDDDIQFDTDQQAAAYWRSTAHDLRADLPLHMAKLTGYGSDTQLEDTNAALEEFQQSSRELEEELEKDAERQKQLTVCIEQLQSELLEVKAKYSTALKEHAHTLSHMQKELESVRASEEGFRKQVVDMELSNDGLEKSERALESTLTDVEARYGRAIERAALLEEELVAKARLEEENQRYKDELRDTSEELAMLRDQLSSMPRPPSRPFTPPGGTDLPSRLPGAISETSSPVASTSATPFRPPTDADADTTPRKASDVRLSPRQRRPSTSSAARSTLIPSPRPTLPSSSSKPNFPTETDANKLPSTSSSRTLATDALKLVPQKRSTPRALREQRAQTMVSDLKSMSDRVKMLTARVDARRQTFTASQNSVSSSIPRPRRLSSQFTATLGASRNAGTPVSMLKRTSIRSSVASPNSLQDELARASSPLPRPVPKRPASRQSVSSIARPQTPSSRSSTPSLYNTPTYATQSLAKKAPVSRPGFGSSASSGRLPPSMSAYDLAARARKDPQRGAAVGRRQSLKISSPASCHEEEEERF